MCKVLQIPRSTYYYEAKERATEDDITSDVIEYSRQAVKIMEHVKSR